MKNKFVFQYMELANVHTNFKFSAIRNNSNTSNVILDTRQNQ